MVLKHISDIKIFKYDYSKSIYQLTANLVGKVVSPVTDPFMDQLDDLDGLLSLQCTFWSFR